MKRALASALAFGLCVAVADITLAGLQMTSLRMPPMPATAAQAAAAEIALAMVLGVLLTPLFRGRAGKSLHFVALAGLWIAIARFVALDPGDIKTWVTAPAVGLVACFVGAGLARWSRLLAWALGGVALAAAIAAPTVVASRWPDITGSSPAGVPPEGAPDVVLVVLDTVRAANVTAYGYARPTTPVFDRVSLEGALFLDATAPSTWSLPSHASLFTGLFPSVHRAHGESRVLAGDVPTLAAILGANGYATLCFTANAHISDGFGLTRGFQWQDRAWLGPNAGRSFLFIFRVLDLVGWTVRDKGGARVVDNFESWLEKRPADGPPAFAFLNFLEAHFPYHQTPKEFLAEYTTLGARARRDASLKAMAAQFGRDLTDDETMAISGPSLDMYDAGVAYTDFLLGRVVEALRRHQRLDRTLLVVLADHGEMIGEHGEFGHGPGLYEPDVRVPLLLRYPPRVPPGKRVEIPVSTVGVYATVLDIVGIDPPRRAHVTSLRPLLSGGRGGEPVIVERFAMPAEMMVERSGLLAMRDRRYRVYRSGARKLAVTSKGDTFLFDLKSDPGELSDLAPEDPENVRRLGEELDAWVSALGLMPLDQPVEASSARVVDPAAEQRLRALGYVD